MTGEEQRTIGVLMAKVESLETRFTSMEGNVIEVRDALVSLRGGWKFALILASVIGGAVGFAGQFLPLFQHKP